MNISIVITAYNRPTALKELLRSINRIRTKKNIPLIISIDNNGTPEVNKLAEEYVWNHGEKQVIIHKEKKGLVKHFIWTGDQTEKYDTVIFLEDDLVVSPEIINYVEQISEFYKDDERVAAASLYNPFINEMTYTRFYQIEDGYDNYFFQQPYWGHVWFKKPWKRFQDYLKTYKENKSVLPYSICDWKGSFKKIFIQYLIETNSYVVTTRSSYVTNNGIPGLHTSDREKCFQSNMVLEPRKVLLSHLSESKSIYDASYEILPDIIKQYNSDFGNFDFEVDITGTKRDYKKPFVLTTKPVKAVVLSYSEIMKPIELAAILDVHNATNGLVLAKAEDVIQNSNFVSRRRYNDILKNYPMGVEVSFQLFFYGIRRIVEVLKMRYFKK